MDSWWVANFYISHTDKNTHTQARWCLRNVLRCNGNFPTCSVCTERGVIQRERKTERFHSARDIEGKKHEEREKTETVA